MDDIHELLPPKLLKEYTIKYEDAQNTKIRYIEFEMYEGDDFIKLINRLDEELQGNIIIWILTKEEIERRKVRSDITLKLKGSVNNLKKFTEPKD